MKKSLLILPITAALLLTAPAMAAPDYANKEKHSSAKMLKRLDLTEQQKSDMRSLRKQGEQDRLVFRQDIKEIEQQLQSVIRASEWNEQAATALLIQKQQIKSQLALTRASSRSLMWKNLTDEQQEKLSARPNRESKKGKKRNAMRQFKALDLSDNQRQAIATIVKQQKSANSDLIARTKDFKKQEVELIRAENFEEAAWQQLYAQQSELDISLSLAKAFVRHQIWNQLDAAQQVKMDEMASKRKEKMHKHAKDRM